MALNLPDGFTPTDVLLNADGSVYHLSIPFGVLPDTIVLVGDPDRVPLVSSYFDQIQHTYQKREFVTHIGRIGQKQIGVVSTGIGTDNVEIVLQELDILRNVNPVNRAPKNQLDPLHLVRIGTTGALLPEHVPGTIICSSGATGFDSLMHFYAFPSQDEDHHEPHLYFDSILAQSLKLNFEPYTSSASWPLLLIAAKEFAITGHTATCPGFYAPQGRITRTAPRINLLEHLPSQDNRFGFPFLNFEMETAGLFALAHLLGHKAASFSLVAANRATGDFSLDLDTAMHKLIQLVLREID
jgi:uridine phosphorylase